MNATTAPSPPQGVNSVSESAAVQRPTAGSGTVVASWVSGVDPAGLSSAEMLDFIVQVEAAKRELEAIQLTVMAAFEAATAADAGEAHQVSAHETASAELGLELQMPPGAASARMVYATRLLTDFPGIHARLRAGELDEYRARLICDLPPVGWEPELCTAYEARMLTEMGARTGVKLKNLGKRVIVELAPEQAQERRERTLEGRDTFVSENHPACGPGVASLIVQDIDAVDALTVQERLGSIARGMKREGSAGDRSMGQLRADIAVALLLGRPIQGHAPTDSGATDAPALVALPGVADPHPVPFCPVGKLHVIIPLSALPAEVGGSSSATLAEIAGRFPLLAEAARAVAARATGRETEWSSTVTDDDGDPVAQETSKYRPPKKLRSHIDARDRTCRFPHCNKPAVECDADHTQAHHTGGATDASNLAALCRKHHRLKQHPKWKLTQPTPGELHWRTPHKRVHTTTPDPYPTG